MFAQVICPVRKQDLSSLYETGWWLISISRISVNNLLGAFDAFLHAYSPGDIELPSAEKQRNGCNKILYSYNGRYLVTSYSLLAIVLRRP
jgi:hypothetical protein